MFQKLEIIIVFFLLGPTIGGLRPSKPLCFPVSSRSLNTSLVERGTCTISIVHACLMIVVHTWTMIIVQRSQSRPPSSPGPPMPTFAITSTPSPSRPPSHPLPPPRYKKVTYGGSLEYNVYPARGLAGTCCGGEYQISDHQSEFMFNFQSMRWSSTPRRSTDLSSSSFLGAALCCRSSFVCSHQEYGEWILRSFGQVVFF